MIEQILQEVEGTYTPMPIGPKRLRNPSTNTKLFLKMWARKDPRAASYLDDDVKRELKITVGPQDRQKYAKAFKFRTEQEVEKLFDGQRFVDMYKGQQVAFNTTSVTTWAKTIKEAMVFGDVSYDNFSRKKLGLNDFERLGIGDKQPIGFSIVVMCLVPWKDVIADLSYVPRKYLTKSTSNDIIVAPASFVGTVLSTNTAQADITGMRTAQQQRMQQLQDRDEVIQTELEQISKTEKVVPQLVKKSGLKEKELNDTTLIQFVSQFDDQAIAMGVLLAYGQQFPKVEQWIADNQAQFVKTPWKFVSLGQVLKTRKRLLQDKTQ